MKIAFNPSTVEALITPPNNKDITFDLRGQNIFARGVKFCGTDTNTWRDIKINNVSIDSNILDLRDSSTTTLTNINGVVTINSTWRPVVDNLTSDSTTSSLSANQGRVLKALIDGKSDSDHNHDDRYLRLTGGQMLGALNFANNTWNKVGDDVYIGDHNVPGVFCIKSANNNSEVGILFYSKDGTDNASIQYNNAVKRIYIDKEVAVRNHRLWIQGEGPVGGNNNRLTLVGGMPNGLAYNTSCRGTILYSNGIAFADPYNGNSNNDGGWIRHLETTPNHGILEIAVGDDASNEEIHFRWYNANTSAETIANDITVPKATGTLALTSNIPTVTNYYWANVKISDSSSTTTSPTVSNLTATSSIRMGHIYLQNTNEINSSSGIRLNYQNSGNISLCQGGGMVGIGTASPSHRLDVIGDIWCRDALNVGSTLSITDSVINCSSSNISIKSKESGSLMIGGQEVIRYDSDYINFCKKVTFLQGLSLSTSINPTLDSYTTDDVTVLIGTIIQSQSFYFKPANDGQLLFLKIGRAYSNVYFWCTAKDCEVVKANGFDVHLARNVTKNYFNDGLARIFIYIQMQARWYEFYCG